jgi:hypothetical protein
VATLDAVTISGGAPYKFSVTLPALTAGQSVEVRCTATIATIATASVVAKEQADTSLCSDVGLSAAAVDAIWDEYISPAIHATAGTAGDRLLKSGYVVKNEDTCLGGAAQTITLAATASVVPNIYCEDLVTIIYGTGIGQSRLIVSYSAGRVATLDRAWDVVPISGDSVYQVTAFTGLLYAATGKAVSATANTIVLDAAALAIAGSYVGCNAYISSGTGAGQTRTIISYAADRTATISRAWDTTPDNTSTYKIIPFGRVLVDWVAADAINASALATDAVAEIASAVWAYITRTITLTGAQIAAILAGTAITIHRGDTASIALTALGNIAARTKLWFTVKSSSGDADADSIIQLEETGGLLYLNGAVATASAGSLTVTDPVTGAATVGLTAATTAALTVGSYRWDVQMLTATGVTTLAEGAFHVDADITLAVS